MKTINKKIIADLLISLGCIFAWTIVFAFINASYSGPVLLVIRLFAGQSYLPGIFVVFTEIIGLLNLVLFVKEHKSLHKKSSKN